MSLKETKHLDADEAGIAQAANLLVKGGLVAFPTETVYGLGADATSATAVANLYAAKGRPQFNPLIAHVSEIDAALSLGMFNKTALALAEAFWPGPLTLVVPASAHSPVCELARAGLPSIAIRVPSHPVAAAILRAANRPIAAPSANRSGHVSPTSARHVADDLSGEIDAILDGGTCDIGVESTIISCLGEQIALLRPGGISRAQIESATGASIRFSQSGSLGEGELLAPGQMASHYAPRASLRLNATEVKPGEACLAFGLPLPAGAQANLTLNLSEKADLTEAAANLYQHLRVLDALGAKSICTARIPSDGIGDAIVDRLKRAAAPRGNV